MSRPLRGPVPHCPQSLRPQTKGESFKKKKKKKKHPTQESEIISERVFSGAECVFTLALPLTRCLVFFRVLNLHSQASPVTRAPSMPPVETSYIPPPPPLIQDYRHYYHTTSDLPGERFGPRLGVEISFACLGDIQPCALVPILSSRSVALRDEG